VYCPFDNRNTVE
jgi:ApaG protein